MRIVLKKGKQTRLIKLAKKNLSWSQLSKEVNLNYHYLSNDLKNEWGYISEEIYRKLCELAKINFNKFIIEKKENNWGQSKGGLNSPGSLKEIPKIEFDEKLAEFVGAVLGDGHVEFYKKGKKIGVYSIRIAGDLIKDKFYHVNYLKPLAEGLFKLQAREITKISPKGSERFLDIKSRKLVEFFISMGIKPGDKIKNQSTIPKWIFRNKEYLRACIRGLIDTDGSIARMSQRDFNLLRIFFTNHNLTLLRDTRDAFLRLEFHPSKLMNNRQFYLSRQGEIERYIKEISFSNKKHLDRLKRFKAP